MANTPNFKQLLDSLNTAVIVVDNQLCVCHLNTAAEVLLETSSALITGSPLTRYFHESEAAVDALQEAAD